MKRTILGSLLTLGLLVIGASSASAQGFGYSFRHGGHNHSGPSFGGYRYSGFGYNQGWIQPRHSHWHNTSHWDYHPGSYQQHYNHFDYVPGHYDRHRSGHWDHH
jgi:hypothetical protein